MLDIRNINNLENATKVAIRKVQLANAKDCSRVSKTSLLAQNTNRSMFCLVAQDFFHDGWYVHCTHLLKTSKNKPHPPTLLLDLNHLECISAKNVN